MGNQGKRNIKRHSVGLPRRGPLAELTDPTSLELLLIRDRERNLEAAKVLVWKELEDEARMRPAEWVRKEK